MKRTCTGHRLQSEACPAKVPGIQSKEAIKVKTAMMDIRHLPNTGFETVTWSHVAKARLEFLTILFSPTSHVLGLQM